MPTTFIVPSQLRGSDVFEFTSTFWDETEDDVVFDFSRLSFAFPSPTLVLAAEIQSMIKSASHKSYAATGIDFSKPAHSYLGHIGFFKHAGINLGSAPGIASGGATYIPIKTLSRSEIEKRLTYPEQPIGAAIQKEAEDMARLLTESQELKVYRPIAYCIREVIRNVFEHADIDICSISGQRFKEEVELAIVDRGCGVRSSLSRRYDFPTDGDALLSAIKPGVSRSEPSGENGDQWSNSGFGLYVLSELGKRTGTFCICSGSAEIKVSKDKDLEVRRHLFHGTAIRLKIQKPKGVNFTEYIEKIISDGETIALQSPFPRRASKSTKTI